MYKTRDIKTSKTIKAAVLEGCVVERLEKSGNYMQVFANNGNILKRTYHVDTKQWGNLTVSKAQNWMGAKIWQVIQDENGKDLHFGGDISSFKVQPPFLMKTANSTVIRDEPQTETVGEEVVPQTETESPSPMMIRKAMIHKVVDELAAQFDMPTKAVIAKLTEIKREMESSSFEEVVNVFKEKATASDTPAETEPIGFGMCQGLMAGKVMRVGTTTYKLQNGTLFEHDESTKTWALSRLTFNQVMHLEAVEDVYPLSFDQAVEKMRSGAMCIPQGMNVRFKMVGDNIEAFRAMQGFPVSTIRMNWRVYEGE